MIVYELESENLTGLGGPMGTEETWTNWRRLYSSLALAKAAAEKDFKNHTLPGRENITWRRKGNRWYTQDLRFVMYHVRKITVTGERDE